MMADKVLIVATVLTGDGPTGVETHFNQIIAESRNNGVETVLVSAERRKDLRRKVAGMIARALRRFSAELSYRHYREANACHLERRLDEALKHLAGKQVTIYAQDTLSARAALRSRAQRGDRRTQVVMTVHFNISEAHEMQMKGLTSEGRPLWIHAMQAERETLPQVDHLIFVSRYMRHQLLLRRPELKARPHRLVPNFYRRGIIEQAETRTAGDLIAIGTLEPRKNQQFILRVLAHCKALGYVYSLTLVGDGPDAPFLVKLAEDLGIAAQVTFLGRISNAARLLPAYRVFLHAAVEENLSIAIIEALAYGKPVVTSAVGGIPELIEDGIHGFFWPLNSVSGAANKLIGVLESAAVREAVAGAARSRYEERLAPEVLVPKWLNAILDYA